MAPRRADGNRSGEGEHHGEGELAMPLVTLTRRLMSPGPLTASGNGEPLKPPVATCRGEIVPARERDGRDVTSHGFRSGEPVSAGTAAGSLHSESFDWN